MPWVMCQRDWSGVFKRSVRDVETGAVLRVLYFAPEKPIEVSDADLPSIAGDIGKALRFVTLDAKGRATVVESAAEANSLVPLEESGPDAGRELVPLEQLSDEDLLRICEEEKIDLSAAGDRDAIVAALRAAGIDDVEVDTELDLEALSISELKKLAAEQKLDVSKCRKKADFVKALSGQLSAVS